MLACHDVANREVGADDDGAVTESCEDAACFGERCRVDIEAEKTAGRRASIEDGLRMASPTERAVEEAASFAGIKLGEYLGQKNRLVTPRPESARSAPMGPCPCSRGPASRCFTLRPRDP